MVVHTLANTVTEEEVIAKRHASVLAGTCGDM